MTGEAFVHHKSRQVDEYEMRLFMRGAAILAALAALSLLYQYTRHSQDSLYLIYALMAAVFALWSWDLRFDDPDFGSPAPRSRAGGFGASVTHLLVYEGFLTALHIYNRHATAGMLVFAIWGCIMLALFVRKRVIPERHKSLEREQLSQRQFPSL